MAVPQNSRQGVNGDSTKPELLTALWPLFLIGKVFGMIHIQRTGPTEVIYAPKTVYTTISVILWSNYFIFFIFAIIKFLQLAVAADVDESLVEQFNDLIYHVHILLTVTFSMHQSKKFPDLFQFWRILEEKMYQLESLDDLGCCKLLQYNTWNGGKIILRNIKFNFKR